MSKRTELINESESNLFFIYDAADSTDKNNYFLKLFVVKLDGTKHVIDILIPDIFFDIKLDDSSLIYSYKVWRSSVVDRLSDHHAIGLGFKFHCRQFE